MANRKLPFDVRTSSEMRARLCGAHQTNNLESAGRDDQRTLLSYYSSETTSHATNLLALSLVILTAVQISLNIAWNCRPVLAGVFFILFATGAWMAGKMMYWAALSSAIMYVPAGGYGGTMDGLHQMAVNFVKTNSRSPITKFSNSFRSLSWHTLGLWVAVLAGIIVAAAVLLLP